MISRILLATSAMLLGASPLAGVASAAPAVGPLAVTCGQKITRSTTLTADLGPCPGDGIDIVANGVTLNLNGHSITGADTTNTGTQEQVGINLLNVSGVTVTGPGSVQRFDAGLSVTGGGGNTIKGLNVHDNIAHVVLTGGLGGFPNLTPCNLGDGITTDNSTRNTITGNQATHNGPFSGISLVDTSTHSYVTGNQVTGNTVSNTLPDGSDGPCGPFQAGASATGRTHQNFGIRIEGPGAANNVVDQNIATGNQLDGIGIFDNVCPDAQSKFGGPPATPPNTGNLIQHNTVQRNGFAGPGENLDGIGILSQGPAGIVCVPSNNTIIGNNSSDNAGSGIFVAGRGTHGNQISANTVLRNGADGIQLSGPGETDPSGTPLAGAIDNTLVGNVGHGNGEWDGNDQNSSCDHNRWVANNFGTVNQLCVAGSGGRGILKILNNGASGTPAGLLTNWTAPVTVKTPSGFTVYSDSTCTTLTATGVSATGNGTTTPTVALNHPPAPGNYFYKVAAGSVTAAGQTTNAAVACTPVTFFGTTVTITGTLANPTITVTGRGFGAQPPPNPPTSPSGQQGCPPAPPDAGFLYGNSLYLTDVTAGWTAGRNFNGEFDCLGLLIQSWSDTKVVFKFGPLYDQNVPGNQYVLHNGDIVQVFVNGEPFTTTVSGLG